MKSRSRLAAVGSRWDAGAEGGASRGGARERDPERGSSLRPGPWTGEPQRDLGRRAFTAHLLDARCLGRRCGYGVASGAVKRRPV